MFLKLGRGNLRCIINTKFNITHEYEDWDAMWWWWWGWNSKATTTSGTPTQSHKKEGMLGPTHFRSFLFPFPLSLSWMKSPSPALFPFFPTLIYLFFFLFHIYLFIRWKNIYTYILKKRMIQMFVTDEERKKEKTYITNNVCHCCSGLS